MRTIEHLVEIRNQIVSAHEGRTRYDEMQSFVKAMNGLEYYNYRKHLARKIASGNE